VGRRRACHGRDAGIGRHAAVRRRVPGGRDLVLELLLMAVGAARPELSPPRTGASRRTGLIVIGGLAALAVLVRITDPERVAWLQNFLIVFGLLLVAVYTFL